MLERFFISSIGFCIPQWLAWVGGHDIFTRSPESFFVMLMSILLFVFIYFAPVYNTR